MTSTVPPMVEAMARAIQPKAFATFDRGREAPGDWKWLNARKNVERARGHAARALDALATPDAAMIAAGEAITDRYPHQAEPIFTAMINAARGREA